MSLGTAGLFPPQPGDLPGDCQGRRESPCWRRSTGQLSTRLRRARYAANLNAARWNDAVAEHEEILAALTARDGARLGALLQEHFLHKVAELAHHPIHPAAHDTNAAG